MTFKHALFFTALTLSLTVLSSCTSTMTSNADLEQMTKDVLARSFRAQGQAQLDRLQPDEDNNLCSEADRTGVALSDKVVDAIQNRNFKTIQAPTDGKYLGDYKLGEKIAQSGAGKTWSDAQDSENGGNCYNCHQISKEELSYGNLGPSLYHYGVLRGVKNPESLESKAIVEYTWGKIQNPRAYNACSNMPRFGHKGILTQTQIKHIMALLLDPRSPVNQ